MTIQERIEDYKRWTVEYNGNKSTTSPHYVLSLCFENEFHYYDVFKKHCQENFGIKDTLFEVEDPEFFEKIKNSIEGMEEYKPFIKKENEKRLDGGFLQSGLRSYLLYLDFKVLGHRTFVFPCNTKQYDCIECFKQLNTVDWRQNISKCNPGDIVYIYLTRPFLQIQFKTVIEKTNIPFNQINRDDFKFYTDTKYIPQKPEQLFTRLRLLETYGDKGITLQQLKDFGISYNIQGQGQLPVKTVVKMEEFLHPTHPRGLFSSWEVLSDTVVLKHTDKSFFEYRGSGVPKEIQWFFDFENKKYPERKDNITLVFKDEIYTCYVSTEPVMDRTRIFWDPQLGTRFNSIEKEEGSFPTLRFHKLSSDKYEIDFIDLDNVEEDTNNPVPRTSQIEEYEKEGKKVSYWTTRYERKPENRRKTIELFGTKCMVCGFDFEKTYGEWGKDFIEVHHIKPLSDLDQEVEINPETDLICLCSNCHSMIHRKKNQVLSIEELRSMIKK